MTRFRLAAVVAVSVLGLAACGSDRKNPAPSASSTGGPGSVKVGFLGALTGADAALGVSVEDGEKLALSQYNVTNPTVKVVLDPFDSHSQPAGAAAGAHRLVSDKDVAVVGPTLTSEATVADPVFERARVPNVTPSAAGPVLAEHGWTYFHRVVADSSAEGPADADFLVKAKGAATVAVIDDSSAYGVGLGNAVRMALETSGGKDVLDAHVNPKQTDYGATVDRVMSANPAAVFFGGYDAAAGRLVNQLRAKGYTGLFMSGGGANDAGFVTDAGPAAAEGAFLSCTCADTTNNPRAQSFNAAYWAAYGRAPASYSAEAYDATNGLLAAIKAGNTTGPAINSYLANNAYPGITKTIKFEPDGDIVGASVYIDEVKSGKITQVGTSS